VLLFLAGWAPWLMFPERTMFYFYSIVYLPFLVMAIAYIASLIYVGISARESSRKVFFIIGGILLVLTVVISVFFYPVWTAIQLPKDDWLLRMWFRNWI
jgi:dolichyl-phosphate-mannose--protein O-mannosyl transferase